METQELQIAALRALFSRRREGAFVDAEGMDTRLQAMIAEKRRVYGLSS